MRRGLAVAALLLLAVLAAGDLGAQCVMCKTALTNSAEGQGIAPALNRAILLMIAAPYVVFGTVGLVVFRGRLRDAWRRRFARGPSAH